MLELIKPLKGNLVFYFLIFLSLLSWYVIFERLIYLLRFKPLPDSWKEVKTLLSVKNYEGGYELLKDEGGISQLFLKVIEAFLKGQGKEKVEEVANLYAKRELEKLEENLNLLYAVGSLAPLVGLLGTVFGLIKVFSSFSLSGGEEAFKLLSRGISESLTSTGLGLLVAVPSITFYYLLDNLISKRAKKLEEALNELLNLLN